MMPCKYPKKVRYKKRTYKRSADKKKTEEVSKKRRTYSVPTYKRV